MSTNNKINEVRNIVMNNTFTKKTKEALLGLTFGEAKTLFSDIVNDFNKMVTEHNSSNRNACAKMEETKEYKSLYADYKDKLNKFNIAITRYNNANANLRKIVDGIQNEITESAKKKFEETERNGEFCTNISDEFYRALDIGKEAKSLLSDDEKSNIAKATEEKNKAESEYSQAKYKLECYTKNYRDDSRVGDLTEMKSKISKLQKFIVSNHNDFAK